MPTGGRSPNPPSLRAGGAFASTITNRAPQFQPGSLRFGAIGNALLGGSPDGTNKAVFAVATTDGGLAQVNVEHGVDGLAPSGTLGPAATRIGMVFNWVPDRFLYVADPGNDAVLQLHLRDDFQVFQVLESRRLEVRTSQRRLTLRRPCRRSPTPPFRATPPWPAARTCTSPTAARAPSPAFVRTATWWPSPTSSCPARECSAPTS